MLKKSSWWLVVLVGIIAVGFLATGCAKKSLVKEEVAGRSAAAQPTPAPAPVTPPKAEAQPTPAPAPAAPTPAPPKAEAAPPAPAVPSIDLASLRLQFAFDDYSLSSKSKENLEKLAAWMKKANNVKVQVEGHTCDIGTNEYNLALGERRANSAKSYLEGLGVSSARISTISYGEERPMVPNSDEANRSKNRRDDFVAAK